VVLAGFELSSEKVADLLIEAGYGQTPDTLVGDDKGKRQKLREQVLKQLAQNGNGKVEVFAEVGTIRGADKRKAIEQHVGENTLGLYRAPNRSAWKGVVEKRPPKQTAPEVTVRDD
jgi:hypothetical protein